MTERAFSNDDQSLVAWIELPISEEAPDTIVRDGQTLKRDWALEGSHTSSGTGTFITVGGERRECWPQHSGAMAVHPEQISEAREVYAKNGVKGVEFNKWGEVKCESSKHKDRLMKARGFYDKDGCHG